MFRWIKSRQNCQKSPVSKDCMSRERVAPSSVYSNRGASSGIVILFLLPWIHEMQLEVSLKKRNVREVGLTFSYSCYYVFPIFYTENLSSVSLCIIHAGLLVRAAVSE